MRGRIGWWRRDQTGQVVHPDNALPEHIKPGMSAINADVIPSSEEVANVKRRRISSPAFAEVRRAGVEDRVVNGREDVKERASRIEQIAHRMRAQGWEDRSASWIADRLAPEWGLSPNTLRQDVAKAKKLMGSQPPKN